MKVLLIQPSATRKKLIFLGLGYIAAVLEQRGDHVEIIDLALESNPEEVIEKKAKESNFDIVGVSASTPTYPVALHTLTIIKEIAPSCITIMGGSHSSILTDDVLRHPAVDIVVKGEGEITIVELLDALEKNRDLKQVTGISFKRNGQIIHNPYRSFIEDLDSIPFPARHLYNMERYSAKINGRKATSVITSRGCPFNCVYCYRGPAAGKKLRCRSPENVIKEIKLLKARHGISGIFFYDDTFTLDKKRALLMCDLFIKQKLNIVWTCQTRVDCLDLELLKKMKKAGCVELGLGIESGNEQIMNLINKKIKKKQARQAFKLTKEAGICTRASFILGLPWDTRDTIRDTIDFAMELNPDFVDFFLAVAYPGTKLWQIAEEKNINLPKDWSTYNLVFRAVDWNAMIPLFQTEKLTKDEFIHFVRKAHLKFLINKLKDINSIFRSISLLFLRRGLLLSEIKSNASMYLPNFKSHPGYMK